MKGILLLVGFFVGVLSSAQALCVLSTKANLRKGPGSEFSVSMEAIPYTPLKKISKKNGWYQVEDMEKKSHWIREDLVTSSFRCAAIKTEFANLRKGPGKRFEKAGAGVGEKYLAFRLLEEKGDWARLEDTEGDEVWVQKQNLWID
jgi:uncharacterized protein YgiM (DUF1202 family)